MGKLGEALQSWDLPQEPHCASVLPGENPPAQGGGLTELALTSDILPHPGSVTLCKLLHLSEHQQHPHLQGCKDEMRSCLIVGTDVDGAAKSLPWRKYILGEEARDYTGKSTNQKYVSLQGKERK